ncbi:unnamed protein product [Oppiella nova]|uniref:Protein OSCP1 n=1 Tax=Oppiella nova TaxID=334625 RepID=A0A7R9L9R7_9ACAR|nr:unnamed protein product [Oppiella nova]CAG2161210.1 unnamed protein product [Oppiella nova]
MSREAFPVLYFNLGGEMIYIVEQRLTAQSIDTSKADKVIIDIFNAMFNPGLISEVFKKQQLLSVYAMRQMFEKLAHSSIMKLNDQSMNKLFDLMVMVTKYQIVFCNTPLDLIHITLNHLESMSRMARLDNTLKLIESSKEKFINYYLDMNWTKLQHIRHTILTFLQDIQTRVSIFLRDGTQENDGKFVIKPEGVVSCDCQMPGVIKYFNQNNEVIEVDNFDPLGQYVVSTDKTFLGLNIYTKEYSQNTKDLSEKQSKSMDQNDDQMSHLRETNDSAKHELDLLAKLIGREKPNETEIEFWLNLGHEEPTHEKTRENTISHLNELNISEGIHKTKNLESIINDLDINSQSDETVVGLRHQVTITGDIP